MSDHVFLYACTTVEVSVNGGVPLGDFTPGWAIGDILVEAVDHGPEWIFGPEDSVASVAVTAVKVGGRIALDDGTPEYTRGVARLLALIQLGARQEEILEGRLQTFAEDVREQILDADDPVKSFRLTELTKKYLQR